MKAIILASGEGKRLRPLTKKLPKPLIKLNGTTILERIIQSLVENNITDIIITTGHLEEKIKEFVKEKYPGLKIAYVKNPVYDKTNYIYSLWLAKESAKDDDIILLHGDLIYDSQLMKKIVKAEKSSVLIREGKEVPEKDFKGRIKDGLIKEIGVKVFGEDARFCAPLYKILKPDFEKWLEKIEEFIKINRVNCYAEDAFNEISNQIQLHPLYYDKEFCMEIDTLEDLERAKDILKK